MKLSFVNQPWTTAAPPKNSDSTGTWSYQISLHLIKYSQIIYYGCKDALSPNKKFEPSLNWERQIEYRGISAQLDKLLKIPKKIAEKLNFNVKLPYFGSSWFNFGYGWQIAEDAARRKCDIIHVHNFSQFVPMIRDRNPYAKIVLHLHCEWVNRLNQEAIAARLSKADLIISCSDYITNKIKERFPQYATQVFVER